MRGAGFEPANAFATGSLAAREGPLGRFKSCAVSGLGYPRVRYRAGTGAASSRAAARAGPRFIETRFGKYLRSTTSLIAATHR